MPRRRLRFIGVFTLSILVAACGRSGFEPSEDPEFSVAWGRYVQRLWLGLLHACAERDGDVYCWGDNEFAQFGFPSWQVSHGTPVITPLGGTLFHGGDSRFNETCTLLGGDMLCSRVNEMPSVRLDGDVVSVSAYHTGACAVQEGRIKCWAGGSSARLGPTPGMDPESAPPFGQGASIVRTGGSLSCALFGEELSCWGQGAYLGRGPSQPTTTTPQPVTIPSPVRHFDVGSTHACAVGADGVVYCWGNNGDGQVAPGMGSVIDSPTAVDLGYAGEVSRVFALDSTTCAVVAEGARCWGRNEWGALGRASVALDAIGEPDWVDSLGRGARVTDIDAAGGSVCARLADGRVLCWGLADRGRSGDGRAIRSLSPVRVTGLPAGPYQMGRGSDSEGLQCVVVGDGRVYCWGSNHEFQLNLDDKRAFSTPQLIGLTDPAAAVAYTDDTVCAVAGGAVTCWGLAHDALGRDTVVPFRRNAPALVDAGGVRLDTGATQLACGRDYCCALVTPAGEIWCWGDNSHGNLGNGTTTSTPVPQRVIDYTGTALSGMDVVRAEYNLTCAWSGTERWCWGNDGAQTVCAAELSCVRTAERLERAVPIELGALTNFQDVAPSSSVSCFVAGDKVYCRGQSIYFGGALNEVTGLPTPIATIGGGYGVPWCVIAGSDRGVWCWGWAPEGQLGVFPAEQTEATPVRMGTLQNVQSISVGTAVCAATTTDVYCWGSDGVGELASGEDMLLRSPTPVALP